MPVSIIFCPTKGGDLHKSIWHLIHKAHMEGNMPGIVMAGEGQKFKKLPAYVYPMLKMGRKQGYAFE